MADFQNVMESAGQELPKWEAVMDTLNRVAVVKQVTAFLQEAVSVFFHDEHGRVTVRTRNRDGLHDAAKSDHGWSY